MQYDKICSGRQVECKRTQEMSVSKFKSQQTSANQTPKWWHSPKVPVLKPIKKSGDIFETVHLHLAGKFFESSTRHYYSAFVKVHRDSYFMTFRDNYVTYQGTLIFNKLLFQNICFFPKIVLRWCLPISPSKSLLVTLWYSNSKLERNPCTVLIYA